MASTGNLRKRGRAWLTYAALLLVGILVGHAIPSNSATPKSVTGTITSVSAGSQNAAATFVLASGKAKPAKYILAASGMPPCLTAVSVGTASAAKGGRAVKVTVGVISVPSFGDFPGGDYVVWVHCPA